MTEKLAFWYAAAMSAAGVAMLFNGLGFGFAPVAAGVVVVLMLVSNRPPPPPPPPALPFDDDD